MKQNQKKGIQSQRNTKVLSSNSAINQRITAFRTQKVQHGKRSRFSAAFEAKWKFL